MKHWLLLLATVLLLCGTALADDTSATPAALELVSIWEEVEDSSNVLISLPLEDVATLSLPTFVTMMAYDANSTSPWGAYSWYYCPVDWDFSSFDDTTPGRKYITGNLSPEADFIFGSDCPTTATQTFLLTQEGMDTEDITSATLYQATAATMALGGDVTQTAAYTQQASCNTQVFGEYFLCDILWDVTTLDVDTPGSYTLWGVPDLPLGFALPEELAPLTCTIGVVNPDVVDLSAGRIDATNSSTLLCTWLYQPTGDITLEYAIEDGDWQADFNNSNGHDSYGLFYYDNTNLLLDLTLLEVGVNYYFRVAYEDTYSNTLHVLVEDDNFTTSYGGFEGDRDGSEDSEESLPPLIQPLPEEDEEEEEEETSPSSSNSSSSSSSSSSSKKEETAVEIVTATSTTLSLLRIAQLSALGDTILFEKQGISVEIYAPYLVSLLSNNSDLLTVTITPLDNGFTLQLEADGATITALPLTQVYLPWTGDTNLALQCQSQDGSVSSSAQWVSDGLVGTTISATGAYVVSNIAADLIAPAQASPPPLLPPVSLIPPISQAPPTVAETTPSMPTPQVESTQVESTQVEVPEIVETTETPQPLDTPEPDPLPQPTTQQAPSTDPDTNVAVPILIGAVLVSGGLLLRKRG